MKPPEEEVIGKIVGRWLRKADLDIDSAEALLSGLRDYLNDWS